MILLVSATYNEIQSFYPTSSISEGTIAKSTQHSNVDILVTGVGPINTIYYLTSALLKNQYSIVINVGIAGSFDYSVEVGDVVLIGEDTFADIGIDDNGNFIPIFNSGLADPNQLPYINGWLKCSTNSIIEKNVGVPIVRGITVSTTTGSMERKDAWVKHFSPDVETMEGAAVFYSCLMAKVPFLCLRGISNRVEPRNKANWNMPLAMENACNTVRSIINDIQ